MKRKRRYQPLLMLCLILGVSIPGLAQDVDYEARLQTLFEQYQPFLQQAPSSAPVPSAPPTPTHKVNVMPDQMAWVGQSITVWGNSNTASGTYSWDFGDGTPAATGTVTDNHYIKADHTYTTVGTYTATLTIYESGNPVGSDQVKITVLDKSSLPADKQLQGDVNIAIENGLEYLYLQQRSDGSWPGSGYVDGPTGFAVLAFLNQGYRAQDPNHDPAGITDDEIYAEYIQAGLDYLFTHTRKQTLSVQPAGDPDPAGLGGYYWGNSRPIYETGMVLMAIASTGTPAKTVNVSPTDTTTYADLNGKTYKEVAEGVVRYLAWAQNESGSGRGGWRYTPNSGDSDNSNAQWPVIGLQAAERLFGIAVPAFVKSELEIWINTIQKSPVGAPDDGSSGYTNADQYNNTAKTGALIAQMEFVGDTRSTVRVLDAMDYIEAHWTDTKDENGWKEITNGNLYAVYSVFKGLFNIGPTPAAFPWYQLPGGFNWRQALDQYLVSLQSSDGSWNGSQWFDHVLGTSAAVLSLLRTVVGQPFVTIDVMYDATKFPSVSLVAEAQSPSGQNGTLTQDQFEVLENQKKATITAFSFDSQSKMYTITYTSPNPDRDGSYREVMVRVTDPDKGVGFDIGSYTAPLAGLIIKIPNNLTAKRNEDIQIPVQISYLKQDGTAGALDSLKITAIQFTVKFSNAFIVAFNVTDQNTITGWETPPFFHISPGQVDISMAGTSPLTGEGGTLVYLNGKVRGEAPLGRRTALHLDSVEVNEGQVTPRVFSGVLTIDSFKVGDVNGDGVVNATDAALILRYVVGLQPMPDPNNLYFTLGTADVSNNGTIGALDAYYILAFTAGLISGFPRQNAAPTISIASEAPRLMEVGMQSAASGLLAVPIRASDLQDVHAAELLLAYDKRALKFVGLAPSEDPSIIQMADGSRGTVRIALAGDLQRNTNGLTTILFEPLNAQQPAVVELLEARLNEGAIPTAIRQGGIPEKNQLWQNYPNPFNPETWIPYQLSQRAQVEIRIYDAAGRLIRMLALGTQDPGIYLDKTRAAYWDGTNAVGEPVSSGVYFYTLRAGDFVATKKLLLLK